MQKLQLTREPLSKWVDAVIKLGRQRGYKDGQIKHWVKDYALRAGYSEQQIRKVLRENGVGVYRTRPAIGKRYPKLTFCHKCDSIGKINIYYPNGKLGYVIVHEKIPGQWGKSTKVNRYRRCYITDKESVERITYELEFYEERDKTENGKRKLGRNFDCRKSV